MKTSKFIISLFVTFLTAGLFVTPAFADTYWVSSSTNNISNTNSGNVGIGLSSPSYTLDVAGFINTNQSGGFKQAGNTILTASSTSGLTLGGIGAGSGLLSALIAGGNTVFGHQALQVATSTQQITAIGYHALQNTNDCETPTGASHCGLTAIGFNALAANTIGYWNTAIGALAMQANTTGSLNNAFGDLALGNNTTGGSNQGIGFQALTANTTGNANTAIGSQAMSNLTGSHSNNVAFGQYSGFYSTSGDSNIFAGNQAGLGGIGTLNDSNSVKDTNMIFLGMNASRDMYGLASTSVMNNSIAIGNNAHVGASNSMALGGQYANAVKVGIGTSTPYATLSIHANNGSTNTTLFAIASSTASATTTVFSVSNTGNVKLSGSIISDGDICIGAC